MATVINSPRGFGNEINVLLHVPQAEADEMCEPSLKPGWNRQVTVKSAIERLRNLRRYKGTTEDHSCVYEWSEWQQDDLPHPGVSGQEWLRTHRY